MSPEHEFTIPLDLKLELERISKKSTTTTTGFFRDVLKSQLNDLNILAQSNAFVLLDKYPIVNACKSNYTLKLLFILFINEDC